MASLVKIIHPTMASQGIKRKHDQEQSGSSSFHSSQPPMTREKILMEKTKNILSEAEKKIKPLKNTRETTEFYDFIVNTISNMDKKQQKKTIGILGDLGEGKTSLLNAILEKRYMLPSGCFGACTAVITQIEANLDDPNYTADIQLIAEEDWYTQLQDLLNILQTGSKDKNKDLTDDAREKITALYGANAEKRTFEALKKDVKFAQIATNLSCSEPGDLASKLKRYIQHNVASSGVWYWPLVKSVTIKIPNCHELLEHIVLVDLPGSGDCNKTRADLWKSKLRDCSSVWILSHVNRAVNNKDAWDILNYCIQDMVQAGECRDINFICTKSDEIEPGEYIGDVEEEIPEDENQTTRCILHRNDRAKKTLLKTIENSEIKIEGMHLQVFTVSSKAFFDPNLGLKRDDTEIPKLQDVLKKINKKINQDLATDYAKEANGVLSLIQSFQSDRNKRMAEADIQKKLMMSLRKEMEKLDCRFDMLRCFLDNGLSSGVKESERSCLDEAKEMISPALPQGQRGFHQILHALCKNGGSHTSKAWKKNFDLNEVLAKHMHEKMNMSFNSIFHVNAKTGISVHEQIDKFSIIQPDTAHPSSPMVDNITKFIKTQEDKLKTLLKDEVIRKKKEIYTSVQATIQNAMASCYEEAALTVGNGSLKEKQNILEKRIESLNYDDVKTEVLKKTDELMDFIKKAFEDELKRSIQMSCAKAREIILWDVSKEIEELDKLLLEHNDH